MRTVAALLLLAVLTQFRTTGESWLLGTDQFKRATEEKVVGDNYDGPVLTIEPAKPDGSDIRFADEQGPVAIRILLPAAPIGGESVEAIRIDPARLRTADWHTTNWDDTYTDNIYMQQTVAGEARIHWDGNAPDSACFHQTPTGWEECR